MAKFQVIKENVDGGDRKQVIREALLKAMKSPVLFKGGFFEEERSFEMQKVVEFPGTRGLLRKELPDFKPDEKKVVREILKNLRSEGILFHKTGTLWAWLKGI